VSAPALPPLLSVTAVMDRYGLRDRRAARQLMDEAGAFYIAGRLVVREPDLDAHERALRDGRREPREAPESPRRPRRVRTASAARREPLAPEWWRSTDEPV